MENETHKWYSLSPSSPLRQARKNTLQLPQNNHLLINLSIQLIIRMPQTNRSKAPWGPNNRILRRQPIPKPTSRNIRITKQRHSNIQATQHKLKLINIRTARAGASFGEVDVQPRVGREIGLAGGEDGVGDVEGEVGVDGGVVGCWVGGEGFGRAGGAGEGQAWDLQLVHGG